MMDKFRLTGRLLGDMGACRPALDWFRETGQEGRWWLDVWNACPDNFWKVWFATEIIWDEKAADYLLSLYDKYGISSRTTIEACLNDWEAYVHELAVDLLFHKDVPNYTVVDYFQERMTAYSEEVLHRAFLESTW